MKNYSYINFKIADFNIRIDFRHAVYTPYFKNKLKKEIMDLLGSFILKNILKERDFSFIFKEKNKDKLLFKKIDRTSFIPVFEKKGRKKIITYYDISLNQFQFILDLVIQNLLKKKGFILHASAIKLDNKAVLFVGKSGVGKSTVIRLLNSHYPALADDVVIIRKKNGNFYFYQTPFWEKEIGIKKDNKSYLINKIFFLKKSSRFELKKIYKKEIILNEIYKQILNKNYSKEDYKILLEFISSFENFFYLRFNRDQKLLIQHLQQK